MTTQANEPTISLAAAAQKLGTLKPSTGALMDDETQQQIQSLQEQIAALQDRIEAISSTNIPTGAANTSKVDYYLSLVCLIPVGEANTVVSEIHYCESMEDAQKMQSQLQARRTDCKKRIITLKPFYDFRNFSKFTAV